MDVTTYGRILSSIDYKDILERINVPVGQPPLKELIKGKKNSIIVIDDLARPTPVFRIMPFLLKEFNLANIRSKDIRILVATGTHGDQDKRALANKIGKETAESCQIIPHNDKRNTRFIGKHHLEHLFMSIERF
jgi:nickel-dependent lactate racemase